MGNEKTVFFIDKAKFTSETNVLTPRRILVDFAKENPSETVLVRVDGPARTKLEALDTPFEVKDGTHFTILHQGPTPVS